jgi:hypothetical protein
VAWVLRVPGRVAWFSYTVEQGHVARAFGWYGIARGEGGNISRMDPGGAAVGFMNWLVNGLT